MILLVQDDEDETYRIVLARHAIRSSRRER